MTGFLKGMSGHQRANPISEDWLTPPEILRALGPFDLDPCASCSQTHLDGLDRGIGSIRYCKCDNGLEKDWNGYTWLNPPYGHKVGWWMAKMAKHGNGIALVFARTETGWFQDCVFKAAAGLFFVMGRIRFHKPDGTPGHYTGGAPSVFCAFGDYAAARLRDLEMGGVYVELSH